MAQKQQTLFVDDLDGGEAVDTVRFGLDGAQYEIDLSAAHITELHEALDQYVAHARRARRVTRRGTRGRRRTAPDVDSHQARTWAREHGIDIHDRGRVPADVVEQFKASASA